MGSSIELSHDLKMKLVDAYKGGKGYKKISKRFGFSVSTIRNVIRKWKSTGSVEVKARSGRPRKISEQTAHLLGRKATENPHMTVKNLQEGLADVGVLVHKSTVQRCLNKQGVRGREWRKAQKESALEKTACESGKETSKDIICCENSDDGHQADLS
uniref:Uncharacterized protein n=2 Tax=Nothobranchius TaxID=28779 RepID=A0A1A8SKU6_9TELE